MISNPRYTAEQEKIITDELIKVQQAFDLGKWKTKSYPRDGKYEYRYFWEDNKIRIHGVFTITNFVEYEDKDIGRQFVSYATHSAKSFYEFMQDMWSVRIYLKAGEIAKKALAIEENHQDWVRVGLEKDKDFKVSLDIPKAWVEPMTDVVKSKIQQYQNILWSDLTALQQKAWIDLYNKQQLRQYQCLIELYQDIHRFIDNEQINQRLGLQTLAFSHELYDITMPKMIEITD